jgi:sec-independent protein translocase protein TatA
MPRLGLMEILIIAFVLMVFFGANRIPDMMRGLARGLRGFKEELKAEEKPDAEAGEKPKTS